MGDVLQAELKIRMTDVERLTAGLSFSSGEVKKFSEEIDFLKQLLGNKEEELDLVRGELSVLIEKYSNQDSENKLENEVLASNVSALNVLKNIFSQRDTKFLLLNEQVD